ncbi:hypothetical protein CIRG_06372 [Coccidioides immitis RMSCC 2394]|uniref:Uncharacterized protein n=1 Tax=Coccidioides immitis RMSCC 2394 TaxID=404692 RepID=A0A0J6YDA4_COCIT|nr:hypothetical protein CIRG_06372 [Coccidioides immitis RMSCC 2394]
MYALLTVAKNEAHPQSTHLAETLLNASNWCTNTKLIMTGLQPSNFWENIVQAQQIPTNPEEKLIYNAKQITSTTIMQTFDYMVKEGVEYEYLTTGEVDADDSNCSIEYGVLNSKTD